jgi:hypothetical protein
MCSLIRALVILGIFTLAVPAGINWKTVWLEPNPIIMDSPGSSLEYKVKGIDGGDHQADLTECLRLAPMLFPVPVEIRQSNVTGGTRFLSCFAPRFALGV